VDVDQDTPDLGSRASKSEQRERTLVGSFMSGLKGLSKAMMRDRSPERNPAPPGTVLSGYESPGRPGSFYVQSSQVPVTAPARAAIRQHHSPSASRNLHDRHGSLDFHEGENPALYHETSPLRVNVSDPVAAEPQTPYDHTKTGSPTDESSDVPFHSRISSIQKLFRDLNDMPWITTHVAADYIPGETNRRRNARRRPLVSWYSHERRRSVDLLSGGSSPTPVQDHRRASSGIAPVLDSSPVVHRGNHRSPKINIEVPVDTSESHVFPKYPHGYVPASQLPQAAQFVTLPSGASAGRDRRETPTHRPLPESRSQHPYPVSRPPMAQFPY